MKQLPLILSVICYLHVSRPVPHTTVHQKAAQNTGYVSRDSVTRNGYTLIFINQDTTFAQTGTAIKQRMTDVFFDVYPKLSRTFNKKSTRKVTFITDPDYKGVAEASNNTIRFSPKWMLRTPTDIDVVTHEVMHLVQDYSNSGGPGWLTEGIADYVRYAYGVDNAGAKWSLPAYKEGQSYTNSYRITARFLAWCEQKAKPGLVKALDKQLRDHTYTANSWQQLTGKTLDELWTGYISNPNI